MGSEGNKISDGTGIQPSEPKLCANECGFFGTAATMNMCSKCYRDLGIKEEQAASAKAAMEKLLNQNPNQTVVDGFSADSRVGSSSAATAVVVPMVGQGTNRCSCCKKKVGVMGFQCRCGATFCGAHRYPEKHNCKFDFKAIGRDAVAKANPLIKADKVERF